MDEILRSNSFYKKKYCLLNKYIPIGLRETFFYCLKKLITEVVLAIKKSNETGLPCVIREFRNSNLLMILPIILIVRKRIWFLINHNFQLYPNTLCLLGKMGIRFLFIDFDYVDPSLMPKNHININSQLKTHQQKKYDKTRVAVFSSHADKIINTINIKHLDFYIAERTSDNIVKTRNNVFSYGTKSTKNYIHLLQTAYIVIIDYGKNYFKRTSGLLWETIKLGNHIVVNDYPVFRGQLDGVGNKQFFNEYDEIQLPTV